MTIIDFIKSFKQEGCVLKDVEDQTPELCMEAVQQNGLALQYVKDQTEAICLAAVQEDGYALKYVRNQTPEICLAAVQQDGLALEYVKDLHSIADKIDESTIKELLEDFDFWSESFKYEANLSAKKIVRIRQSNAIANKINKLQELPKEQAIKPSKKL